MLEQAELLARRLELEAPGKRKAQVRMAFRRLFGREPAAEEIEAAAHLAGEHGLAALARALFNANEFLYAY